MNTISGRSLGFISTCAIFVSVLLLVAGVSTGWAAPLFPNPVYRVGQSPPDMAQADFDGDGIQDLMVANATIYPYTPPGEFSFLRGRGDGSFYEELRVPISYPAVKVSAADFNQDGHPDVAVGYYQGAGLLFGTGDGHFGADVPIVAGGPVGAVEIARLNADAIPDLLVGGMLNGTSFTQALLGVGDGTFTPGPVLSPRVAASAVADVNGDGLDDFLSLRDPFGDPCPTENTILVYLNQGNGAFVQAGSFTTGLYNTKLDPADLDGDGALDLVIGVVQYDNCSGYGGRVLYHGNGDGTFTPAGSFEFQVHTVAIVNADLDGAGRTDYIDTDGYAVTVHLVQPDGTDVALPRFYAGHDIAVLKLGDYDGDGRTDLAALAFTSEAVFIMAGNGDGTFGPPRIPALNAAGLRGASTADFNEDGAIDIVAAGILTADVVVIPGNGDGTFGAETRIPVGTGPYAVTTADFNGDGHQDVAAILFNYVVDVPEVYPDGTLVIILGNGDGTFQAPVPYTSGKNPLAIVVSDFNGDNVQDVAVANWGDGYQLAGDVSLYLGQGDGTMAAQIRFPVGVHFDPQYDPTTPRSLAIGDFNTDGHQDLVVGMSGTWNSANPGEVEILYGDGAGGFTPPNPILTVFRAAGVAVGDLNGDGHDDITVADSEGDVTYAPGGLYVLLGAGDGTFSVSPIIDAGLGPHEVRIDDFNGDGVPDVAATNNGLYVALLAGNGDGTFGDRFNFGLAGVPLSVIKGDFDNNGRLDFMLISEGGAFFYANTSPPPPPPFAVEASVALGGGHGARITWTTNAETDLRGFNVLRITNRGTSALNVALIPCQQCVTALGSSYTFLLSKPRGGQDLYIEAVHRDGRKEIFGPALRQ